MSSPIYKPAHQTEKNSKDKTREIEKTEIPDMGVLDTLCGFWVIQPPLLQPCARIGVFTTFYSMAALVTSTLSVYVTSQITTLERQFGFSSKQTGVIMAANDIGYLACVLFVSYLASRIHIPRSLGIATVIFGLSGIACSLPHFIFGTSLDNAPSLDTFNATMAVTAFNRKPSMFGALCEGSNDTQSSCEAVSEVAKNVLIAPEQVAKASYIIIVIGMMLQGFGKAPRSSLVVTYLDDNTAKANTGFYLGIVTTVGILGPAVAFLMGGVFSRMYVTLQPTNLTPRHPKWIGAWWLGYILFGALALVISLPLFCFPRRLLRKEDRQKHTSSIISKDKALNHNPSENINAVFPVTDHSKRGSQSKASAIKQGFSPKFLLKHSKEFLATLFRLSTNPVYVFMVLSGCFIVFTMGGTSSYTPKYLERMFHLPAHKANYIIAGQILCTSCLGTFIGGYLTKRLKMTAMKNMVFVIVVVSISLTAQIMGFVFQCDQPDIHNSPSDENSSCSNGCNCRDNSYFPVCGGDGWTYYSPCHAGCGQVDNGMYQNCTCIPGGMATSGMCDYSCPHLYAYVIFIGLRNLFGTLSIIPKMIVFIRCVSHADRPMALGVSSFMMSLLGWLLGPIVFGYIIDGICTIWDITCGTRGRCLRYDNNLFRLKLHGFATIGFGLSLVCIIIPYVYARWTKCLDEPKEVNGQVRETTAEMVLLGHFQNKEQSVNIDDAGLEDSESSEVKDKHSEQV